MEPVRNERRVAAGQPNEVLTGGGESGHDQCREAESEMVLDAVCDDNEVESVQLCSWSSNKVSESSSMVLINVKCTVGQFKATAAAVGSGLSRRWAAWVTRRGRQWHTERTRKWQRWKRCGMSGEARRGTNTRD